MDFVSTAAVREIQNSFDRAEYKPQVLVKARVDNRVERAVDGQQNDRRQRVDEGGQPETAVAHKGLTNLGTLS